MAQQSPGVQIIERDISLRIPTVASSVGAIVVAAEKGPVNVVLDISDEKVMETDFDGNPFNFGGRTL
jgi:hypothetical protein